MGRYQADADGVLLPDPQATPGAALSVAMQALCTPGYTVTVRNVPERASRQVYSLYGATKQPGA